MPVSLSRTRAALAAAASLLLALGFAAPADATFPGINGDLAYTSTAGGLDRIPLGGPPEPGADPFPTVIGAATDTARDVHWSPDGGSIVFSSAISGTSDIYSLDVSHPGSLPERLTTTPGADTDPSFSADGRSIAFTSDRGGSYDVWVMGADGSDPRQVTTSRGSDLQPEYSPLPDHRIVFESSRDGDYELFLINDDGTGETQLTHHDRLAADASWSPDGKLLAYTTGPDINSADIAVMAARPDAPPTMVTDSGKQDEQFPSWSPDGRWIAYNTFSATPAIHVTSYPPSGDPADVLEGYDADWGVLPAVDEDVKPKPDTATIGGSGDALIRPPGATVAKPLSSASASASGGEELARSIPFGTRINAQPDGTALPVDLDVAVVRKGPVLRTTVTGGVYTVHKEHGAMRLELADLKGCPRKGTAAAAVLPRNDVTVKRRGGRGGVSTHSRRRHIYTYTTDTEYRVVERCARTTIKVLDGKLTVRRVPSDAGNGPVVQGARPRTLKKGQQIVIR